jgi:hypothetical protein
MARVANATGLMVLGASVCQLSQNVFETMLSSVHIPAPLPYAASVIPSTVVTVRS